MSTLPPSTGIALTYADWAKRINDEKVDLIIELLSQTNEIMLDIMVMEGNLTTGHKTTVRTGLPSATWRLLNYGIATSKSTTAQIVDTCGNLEAESQLDVDVAKLNGLSGEFRLSESKAFIESMNQTMASTLIYGNTATNPERFMGLAPRYNTLNSASAQTAVNVIDMGGTGSDNTSIWIMTWGSDTTHGIFPKGSRVGLNHEDKGVWRVQDANSRSYYAYVDHYKWELGLTVRDWRYAVRLCNIDVSDLNTAGAANLITGLIRAVHRLPTAPVSLSTEQTSDAPSIRDGMGRTVIYCNRTIRTYLDIQALNKTNVLLNFENWHGKPILTFRGVPIRTVDAILNTESRIV